MAFNINEITSQLAFGGARPSKFMVQITNPVDGSGDLKLPFMCRAASLPSADLQRVSVYYFGREVKYAADRTYADWSTTIINDEDFKVRNALERWHHAINSVEGNIRTLGSSAASLYKAQATVTQYAKTGLPIRTYQLVGLWPVTIGEIQLDWSTGNAIEEFTVNFAYDWWKVLPGVTGDGGTNS